MVLTVLFCISAVIALILGVFQYAFGRNTNFLTYEGRPKLQSVARIAVVIYCGLAVAELVVLLTNAHGWLDGVIIFFALAFGTLAWFVLLLWVGYGIAFFVEKVGQWLKDLKNWILGK